MIEIKFVKLSSKMSKIGPVDPQIWPKKWSKWVPEGFCEKISRKMIVTEKMQTTNIIENFVADNIVFGMKVLAHHPEELSLEVWEFTNFRQVPRTFFWVSGIIKAYVGWFLKLNAFLVGLPLLSSRT